MNALSIDKLQMIIHLYFVSFNQGLVINRKLCGKLVPAQPSLLPYPVRRGEDDPLFLLISTALK